METLSATQEKGTSIDDQEAPPEVASALLDELKELDASEQEILAEMLLRAKRDREANGPLDEISFIANDLKSHPETDDWMVFLKLDEKVAPDLQKEYPDCERIALPTDLIDIEDSLLEVMTERTSKRNYSGGPLSLEELSTLLYQAYGVKRTVYAYNRPDVPIRFAPTTGGLQCVELYLVVNAVEGLEQGLYHYHALQHSLEVLERGNFRWKIVEHCPQQEWLSEASVMIIAAPTLPRIFWKYGRRSYRMAHLDTGIVCQNLHLVATGLKLSSCMIMGYQDDPLNDLLGLDGRSEFVVLMLAVGRQMWEAGPLKKDATLDAATGGDGQSGGNGPLT